MKFQPLAIALALATCVLPSPCSSHHAQAGNDRLAAEASRVRRLRGLISRREHLARTENTRELQACDAEIRSLPAPRNGDADALSKILVGRWRSPRHDYLYRADGTWTLLPAEEDTLHGRWRITGNHLEQTSGYAKPESTTHYTVILLTARDNVYTDGETVFYEKRLPR